MKKTVILIFTFIASSSFLSAQTDTIKDAHLVFQRPNSNWHFEGTTLTNGYTIYSYKRSPIIDKENRPVIPNIAFVVEDIPKNIDLVTFSVNKRANAPIEITAVFDNKKQPGLLLSNAIIYKGKYNQNGIEHTVYVIHYINKGKGAQIIMDITSELFNEYENEFKKVIFSIKPYK